MGNNVKKRDTAAKAKKPKPVLHILPKDPTAAQAALKRK